MLFLPILGISKMIQLEEVIYLHNVGMTADDLELNVSLVSGVRAYLKFCGSFKKLFINRNEKGTLSNFWYTCHWVDLFWLIPDIVQ
jgi:hypothetical protein